MMGLVPGRGMDGCRQASLWHPCVATCTITAREAGGHRSLPRGSSSLARREAQETFLKDLEGRLNPVCHVSKSLRWMGALFSVEGQEVLMDVGTCSKALRKGIRVLGKKGMRLLGFSAWAQPGCGPHCCVPTAGAGEQENEPFFRLIECYHWRYKLCRHREFIMIVVI